MKNHTNLLFIFMILLTFSCQQKVNHHLQNCCLTSEDSLSIVNEIMAVTDAWVEANINMDAEKSAAFWDS